jgi:hypothetical protein
MDDKGQMMVIESVIFTITILVALIFLYQLSPTSTVSNVYKNDLKIKGDDALRSLYNDQVKADTPKNFPKNNLIFYLIADNYESLVLYLKSKFPSNTMFNIYISNGTKKAFWCSSTQNNETPLPVKEPVTISHYILSIHPYFLDVDNFPGIIDNNGCELTKKFPGYTGSTYDVILEMFYT